MTQTERKRDHITLITTGGTIEKTYDEDDGSLSNRESVIKKIILSKLRLPYTHLNIFTALNKDSLYMNDEDRELIKNTIKNHMTKGHPIVLLHGTDTMAKTASYCFENIERPNVAVVFTGAMKPMGFDDSDARQNVTEALLAAQLLEPGFYISFHNKVFKVPGVRKNKATKTFEKIEY
jgi:L-asparaginase